MKYRNAAEILPENLLVEIQKYVKGDLLYIPNVARSKRWGENSGSRTYYLKRNNEIKKLYQDGTSISHIADIYGLSIETVKKIIYS